MSKNFKVNDEVLVDRCQHGDHKAFEMLVMKYQYKIAGVVAKYANNQDEVEDMVQETFIKAFKAIKQFKGNSQFYTWLFTIASNVGKNHLAFNSRRIRFVDSELVDDDGQKQSLCDILEDSESSPEKLLSDSEFKQSLIDCIAKLPEEAKEAIYLYEFKNESYEQIAEKMNCPIGTVRSRIFRAREIINEHLKTLLSN